MKTPLRQGLLFLYASALNWALGFISEKLGFEFTDEQKFQFMSAGTPLVWAILSFVDRYMHVANRELPKREQNSGLLGEKGISGF
jgi:hypothetical protein